MIPKTINNSFMIYSFYDCVRMVAVAFKPAYISFLRDGLADSLNSLFVKIDIIVILITLVDVDFLSSAFESPVVRVEKEINSFFTFDG